MVETFNILWCQAEEEFSEITLVKELQHNHHLQQAGSHQTQWCYNTYTYT